MDNRKTGNLIRETRKAKGLTQQNLAQQLHITDRAVSKWERGLNAPDIAMLEPLADILELKVTELIAGERQRDEQEKQPEAIVREIIDYSGRELKVKTRRIRSRTIAILAGMLLLMFAVLWWNGVFNIVGRFSSPDRSWQVTVYDFSALDRFSTNPSVTVQIDGEGEATIVYENSIFENLWWSPVGNRYVISLNTPDGNRICLEDLKRNSETNLNAVLTFGVEASELSQYGYANESGWPEIHYRFLQWSMDGNSLLFYYSFVDAESILHEGYFWYNCKTGTIDGILEMRDTLYFEF